jgi:hypothetical protein
MLALLEAVYSSANGVITLVGSRFDFAKMRKRVLWKPDTLERRVLRPLTKHIFRLPNDEQELTGSQLPLWQGFQIRLGIAFSGRQNAEKLVAQGLVTLEESILRPTE